MDNISLSFRTPKPGEHNDSQSSEIPSTGCFPQIMPQTIPEWSTCTNQRHDVVGPSISTFADSMGPSIGSSKCYIDPTHENQTVGFQARYLPAQIQEKSGTVYSCIEDCTLPSCDDGCSANHCPPECPPACNGEGICDSSENLGSMNCNDTRCLETAPVCLDGSCPYTVLDIPPSWANPPSDYPTDPAIHCQWEALGQSCNVSVSNTNALGRHVLQDHIEPQLTFTCPWDECAEVMDFQQLPGHLMHEHKPDRYICLWQNCGLSFSTHEGLDYHIKSDHANLDCHWAGCEASAKDLSQLKTHVDVNHLNIGFTNTFSVSPSPREPIALSSCSGSSPILRTGISPHPNLFSTPATLTSHEPLLHNYHLPMAGVEEKSNMQDLSDLAGGTDLPSCNISKENPQLVTLPAQGSYDSNPAGANSINICGWLLQGPSSQPCGMEFSDPLDLQTHVDREHIWTSNFRTSSGKAVVCNWRNCKRNGKAFQNKDKLRRHLFIHTGCECSICFQFVRTTGP